MGDAELVQQGDVAVQVLGGTEVQGEHGAGGVVDGAVQGHLGAARLEPGKGAAVQLHEGAHPSLRGAARPVLAGTPPVLGRQPEGPADAADRGAAEPEPLELPQLLGDVAVVDVMVTSIGATWRRGPDRVRASGGRRGPRPRWSSPGAPPPGRGA